MTDDVEVSLHDEISAAFKDANSKTEEVSNTEVVDKLESKKEEPVRDEKGKFSKEEPTVEEQATEEPEEKVVLDQAKAPSSWSPGVREKWATLPEDVKAEIIRREEASSNGVRKLHEEYTPVKRFAESLSPYINEAAQNGLDPTQYIQNVLAGERGLRNPNPQQRFNALLDIAEQYGIPLRQIINESTGQEVLKQPQQQVVPQHVEQELQEMRRFRQETETGALKREVDTFKADKEFFDDVSPIMANLLDSNQASSLADAYEQACWVHPEVRKVLLERERGGKKQEELKKRQATASGAAVKASGAADVTVDTDDDDSIEATVRKAMTQASGRV